ncbi:ChaB family protein [Kaistia granuli]|uniref:ChaB family protein n=1 Tax=Kaistia granuli TaxID=363259 RepID=UPI00035D4339|nr:ChaB family protein [Kaistia granuli]
MPYPALEDLPLAVRAHLPIHAQEIFLAAFDDAWTEYAARGEEAQEEIARRVAWAAVKHKCCKESDQWIALTVGQRTN